jgi:hypothetical protein
MRVGLLGCLLGCGSVAGPERASAGALRGEVDVADYCGEAVVSVARWEDGAGVSAGAMRSFLLGTWVGSWTLDGQAVPASLWVDLAVSEPERISFPKAGQGYEGLSAEGACADRLRFGVSGVLSFAGQKHPLVLVVQQSTEGSGWRATARTGQGEVAGLELTLDALSASAMGEMSGLVGSIRSADQAVGSLQLLPTAG